jgi:hypothetical protein
VQNQEKLAGLERDMLKQSDERTKLLTEQGRLDEEAEVCLLSIVYSFEVD